MPPPNSVSSSPPFDAPDMPPTDDSSLRKRTISEKAASGPSSASPPPSAAHTSTSPKRSFTPFLLLVSLALSGYYAYSNSWFDGVEALTESYALCTRDGAHIHTLDPENPRVECLVVNGSKFTSVGSLGASLTLIACHRRDRSQ